MPALFYGEIKFKNDEDSLGPWLKEFEMNRNATAMLARTMISRWLVSQLYLRHFHALNKLTYFFQT